MPDARPEWRLQYVRTEDVEGLWPLVRPFIAMACEKVPTDLSPEFIGEGAKDGRFRLWLVSDRETIVSAFAIGEHPDGTAEFYTFAADRFGEWMPVVLPRFVEMARNSGKRALRINGRRGWERRMTDFGFRTIERDGRTVKMDLVL